MLRKSIFIMLNAMLILAMVLTACAPAAAPAPAAEKPAAEEAKPEAAPAEKPASEQPAAEAPKQEAAPAEEKPAAAKAFEDKFEVFSWWTSGGEAAALEALFAAFKARVPNAEIINATVAGGGGSAARPVLQTRLAGGDPPDTWQVHPGYELLGQYVEPGYVAPVTDLYKEEGWYDLLPKGLIDMMSKDGEVYGVLTGVHRGNGLWFNKKVLKEQGIEIGETLSVDDFLKDAEKLKAAGITPLCVGDSGVWASAQLFENTLLGVIGPEKYSGLWTGKVGFDDPDVKKAMEVYGKMLDYQNEDHSALSWDQAIKALMEGTCVFSSMGDWAYGEFANAKLKDNEDFGWVSHPGTAGSFMIVADGFPLAKGAPHPENTKEFLRAIGSKETQEAFNKLKGSIPVRSDVDRTKFGPYHNWSMDSFAKDALVPSVVHGSAAPAAFQQALNDAVTAFIVDRDVDAFASGLVAGAKESNIVSAPAAAAEKPAAAKAFEDKFEIFSWWTSGGEAAALDALFAAFKARDPKVEIVNATVAGGGGSAARPVLQARLAGGDPPDTWQIHPGFELLDQYVGPAYVEPITDIYKEEGWNDVVPKGLVEMMSVDGKVYGVLAGVHRGNELWYNKKVLDKQGIKIGEKLSVDDFLKIAEQLKGAGIIPLCVGDSGIWASAELFENTLAGVVGPQKYLDLWNGKVAFDDPDVKKAMEVYAKMLDYQNEDHSALSWDQAVKALMEGKCVFNSMGDWAYGEFAKAKLKDNEDFGWVNHPGTDGSFIVIADGFPLAKGAPHPENAKEFLRAVGSLEAQETFNPLKGSIPARTDVDKTKFGPYHNWSMASFAKDKLLPTVVHGSAAPAAFQQVLNDSVTAFIVDRDVDAFSAALVAAMKESQSQ